MPYRVIKVVEDWGRCNQLKERSSALKFLNCQRQHFDWDNNDLADDEGLVKADTPHPNIPTKFPGINLESEQHQPHHVVKVIKESEDECINAACHNASLDDLPHTNNTGVSTAVDKIKLPPQRLVQRPVGNQPLQ
jgi:hypothetical protein